LRSSPDLLAAIARAHESATLEETVETAAQLEYLTHCLEQLEPRQRKLLELRYRAGESLRGLARETGRTSGAVQVALSRLRHFLLRCVEQRKSAVSHG
jgi:RNA polymerase sigma factor (sigma-70 family)